MINSLWATNSLDSEIDVEVLPGSTTDCVSQHVDARHLALILALVSDEIDHSIKMLRDLAARLSQEFCAITHSEVAGDIQHRLMAATIALQDEDRVQQRLGDLRTTLSLLEQALTNNVPTTRADLDHAIIDQLLLDEIRNAFAVTVGRESAFSSSQAKTHEPSIGDIDLF